MFECVINDRRFSHLIRNRFRSANLPLSSRGANQLGRDSTCSRNNPSLYLDFAGQIESTKLTTWSGISSRRRLLDDLVCPMSAIEWRLGQYSGFLGRVTYISGLDSDGVNELEASAAGCRAVKSTVA
jgi:hypothetical protein